MFPLRYLGAKNWSICGVLLRTPIILFQWAFLKGELSKEKLFPSHYSNDIGPEINKEQTREYLRYTSFGLLSFSYDEKSWVEPFNGRMLDPSQLNIDAAKIRGNVVVTDKAILDRTNLFKVVLIEEGNELVAAFGSMHSHWSDFSTEEAKAFGNHQLGSIMGNFVGGSPLFYEQASDVVEQLKSIAANKNKKLVLTGQSLGGSLAAFAGTRHQVKTIAVNAVQLGAGLQQVLGEEKLVQARKYVDHITIEGEFLNLNALKVMDTVFSLIGLRTPGNFGRRFKLESFTASMKESHDYPIRSFMRKLNYDVQTHSNQLKAEDIVRSGPNV